MPAYINVIARGAELKIVSGKGYNGASDCAYSGIVARRSLVESGQLKEISDLRGRRVSTERTSPSYYRIERLLSQGGLTIDDIVLTNLPAAAELDAFRTGALDASTLSEPWVTRAIMGGHAVMWKPTAAYMDDFQFGFHLFGPTLLSQDRDRGERYLAAYINAVRYLLAEGKSPRVLEIIGKYTKLDVQTLQQACWPVFHPDGTILEHSLENYQVWAAEQNLIDETLPIDALIDKSFLQAVKARNIAATGSAR
jgi:NitT/TauT family transport system substrate-binding protein